MHRKQRDATSCRYRSTTWQQKYDYKFRAESQAARLLNVSTRKGNNWKVPKVYQISVLDFTLDKDDKSPLEWYNMRSEKGKRLGDRLNVIFFSLPKIKKLVDSPVETLSHLEKWGLFLSFADDESKRGYIDRIVSSEGGIMNARTALNAVSQDDINWAIENSIFKAKMDYNTGLYNAREEGLQQGIEQGSRQAKLETARNLLAKDIPAETVAECTGLSMEEVLGLSKQP